ncbi:unnamed protein product [Ixodes persulcatus]
MKVVSPVTTEPTSGSTLPNCGTDSATTSTASIKHDRDAARFHVNSVKTNQAASGTPMCSSSSWHIGLMRMRKPQRRCTINRH